MPTRLLHLLLFLAATLSAAYAAAQTGGGHTIFGDLKVDDSKVQGVKPETFQLVLYNKNAQEIGRQMVSSNGRYRFLGLANGEYDISVQLEQTEVARIHLHLMEVERTEVRKDIELQWQPGRSPQAASPPGTVSADICPHTAANEQLLKKAGERLKSEDNDGAIALLNQIVASDPGDCGAWTELGTAHFRKGNLDEAEKKYRTALERRPSFMPALINLGKLRIIRKDFEAAIEVLSVALKHQPLSADANYLTGEAYLQIKKGSKAVGYLTEALRLDPLGKAEAHLRLAALYKGAGLREKAVAEYEQFLTKRPDYPDKESLNQYIKANKK